MKRIILLLLVIPLTAYSAMDSHEKPIAIEPASHPGLSYQKYQGPLNQIVHILEIDPSLYTIKVAHANNMVQGLSTVEKIAEKHQAIAAINGGFFHGEPRAGYPAGILKIANEWFGIAYSSRAAIGFGSKKINSLIDRVQTKTIVLLNRRKFPVHALNQLPDSYRAVLYTPAFGTETPALGNGVAIVIEKNRIQAILAPDKIQIPRNGYVYILGAGLKVPQISLKVGMPAKISIEVLPQFTKENANLWQEMTDIVGGSPMLVAHNRILRDFAVEKLNKGFINNLHARTAIGITKQGHWIFAVVEKNSLTGSPGMDLKELGLFMKERGAEHALNLDGGGSSTFYYQSKVLNHPELELEEGFKIPKEREVSDAILIIPKETQN